jgi:hypothetical protein
MSIVCSEYNYATPLGTFNSILNDSYTPSTSLYFNLHDNILDGSYVPIEGDIGWWSASLSDENGNFATPLQITVTLSSSALLHAAGLISDIVYPVDFSITYKLSGTTVHTVNVTGNTVSTFIEPLSEVLSYDEYVISITKISEADSLCVLYNINNPHVIARSYAITPFVSGSSVISLLTEFQLATSLSIANIPSSLQHVTTVTSKETLPILRATTAVTNMHSVMKAPCRTIHGKVRVTYSNPLIDASLNNISSGTSYGADIDQITNGILQSNLNYFALFDNVLDGTYKPIDETTEIGWVSTSLADEEGVLVDNTYLEVQVLPRLLTSLIISGDAIKNNYPVDFTIDISTVTTGIHTVTITGNTEVVLRVPIEDIPDIESVKLTITKVSQPLFPATIVEVSIVSVSNYADKDLIDISFLEELSYSDDIGLLGGLSANELQVTFSNIDNSFYYNSLTSLIANQLKKNRKIEAWLGAEVLPGTIEWHKLGIFWSYSWDILKDLLVAKVTAFDTLGLLGTFSFYNHQVYTNYSIGALCELVLEDAKLIFEELEYTIATELYSIEIPKVWFEYSNHMAALNKLASCYPMYVYCNREGVINITLVPEDSPDVYYDVWSESTNILTTSYPTLYSSYPNIINVKLSKVTPTDEEVLSYSTAFNITETTSQDFMFSRPVETLDTVIVTCDETVEYTYESFSWGIRFTFTGTGTITSITCSGTSLIIEEDSSVSKANNVSVKLDGPNVCSISHAFIQTREYAENLADRLLSKSLTVKYNTDVEYTGDISLTITNPVKLKESIAPVDLYYIKRHSLYWNGSLTGTALLTN